MVSIEKSQQPQRSVIDFPICVSTSFLLFLIIILFDAYEYITVPGANHARKHIRTGVQKVHTSVNSMAALVQQMTKEEKQEMEWEVEEAEELVRKKHDEVEEIVERVEEMEKEVHNKKPDADNSTTEEKETDEEKAVEEEKKEEIVEAIMEKELGLENWCGGCKWLNMGFNCDKRVSYMMEQYGISEVAAKEANIEHCSNKGRRMLR